MFTKLFAAAALALAGITLYAAFTQQGAMVLRQENQENFWPRYDTASSGHYRGGVWVGSPDRRVYGGFRGGGPGAGK